MSAPSIGILSATGGRGPHAGRRLIRAGAPLPRARLAMIMLHGRGGAPEDMVGLADHLAVPDLGVLAPEAAGRSWWPDSFLARLAVNEPGLSSGLTVLDALLADLERAGIGPERTVLVGFSQGACLALEAAARLARPFHAVAALSGGLVGTGEAGGPPRDEFHGRTGKTFDYAGRLDGVPALIGCHEADPHIPLARVRESADVLSGMGASVQTMVLPGAGHGVVPEEVAWLQGRVNKPSPHPV